MNNKNSVWNFISWISNSFFRQNFMKMDYPSLSLSVESIQNVLKQHKLESIPPCDTVKHECETCQYQASSYWTLRYHKMTNHLGTKERCNICDYNHPHPTRMKQHYKWAHLGIEYKCEQCDFKTKNLLSTMRSHVKTKHSETKETCTDCDYSHPIASQGCISCGPCSYPELTEDHVLPSA